MSGRLLVVGTPIGNLGDLSPRAAEALRTADLVVAEDTRLAARLLAHLEARRPTLSFNEHNAAERLPGLLDRLARGESLTLTTDAGMPGVSDPGAALVRAARAADAGVEVVPGPSAVTAAVALSGMEASGFLFGGFLPARPASARSTSLGRMLRASRVAGQPLVLFESPHRVAGLLEALATQAPDAEVVVCRELTKRHEEVISGRALEVIERLGKPRGEFVVVVGGLARADEERPPLDAAALAEAALRLDLPPRGVVDLLRAAGVGRREAYRLATRE